MTNSKFAAAFETWAASSGSTVRIVDDGTSDEETKLGAIGDLDLAIREAAIDDDLIVLAGDNLFSESLAPFAELGREKAAAAIGVYDVGDLEAIRRYNAIELDGEDRVTFFEEKPEQPRSTLTGIALYFYPQALLGLVREYLDGGEQPRSAGAARRVALPADAGVRLARAGARGTTSARRRRWPKPTARSPPGDNPARIRHEGVTDT